MPTTLIPHITCRNATEAPAFYQKAFGAEILAQHHLPDGRLMHATLNIDGCELYIVDEMPEHGGHGPEALGGTPVMLALRVDDCDAVYQQAVDAGCTVVMPLEDMFWGDRWGLLQDPFGHQWTVSTTKRQVSDEEIQQAMAAV